MPYEKERKLEQDIFGLPEATLDAARGKPLDVVRLIEENIADAMFLGRPKANLIVKELQARIRFPPQSLDPLIFAELGCYMGYSAILLSGLLLGPLQANPLLKYYSFEIDEEFARIARRFIDLAGLNDTIEVIVGPASRTLPDFGANVLRARGEYTLLDFVLIDHRKDLYVPDLRVLESLAFIAPGTVLVGDNIKRPGAPEYHKYVYFSPEEKRQYNYANPNPVGHEYSGRWNIVYETKSLEAELYSAHVGPDVIDVSECTDYLNG